MLKSAHATVAQLVEQSLRKGEVPGSNPGGGSTKKCCDDFIVYEISPAYAGRFSVEKLYHPLRLPTHRLRLKFLFKNAFAFYREQRA